MRPLALLALCLSAGFGLAALPAAAQSTENYGSVYSGFGLGQRADAPTSQGQMLGGASTALGGQFATTETPALLADLGLTAFAVNLQVQGVRGISGDDQSELVAGTLGGLRLGFPLRAGRLGLGLSYVPYSRVQYEVFREGQIDIDGDAATTTPYRVQYEGGGGLQTVSLGLGARLSPAFQVGAAVDVRFGTIERRTRTRYPQNPSDFSEVLSTNDTQLAGATGTLGAAFSARRFLGDSDDIRVAASLTLPTKLWGDRVRVIGFGLNRDTLATPEGNLTEDVEATLPLVGRLGAAYRPAPGLLVTLDGLYEPWSSFDADFDLPGFTTAAGSALRDRYRLGGGVEIVPVVGRRAGYFARTAYRLGGYAERSLVEAGGTGINTYALTGGVSLPALVPTARFDIGGEIGLRGLDGLSDDGSASLVRDLFFKATATINFGERWFVRRQFD